MQIGIDITPVIYDRGVSRYTANLVRALLERSDAQLSLYGSSLRQKATLESFSRSLPRKAKTVIQHYPPSLQNFLWNTLHVNKIKKTLPSVDIFHSWDWLQPPDEDLPLVSTIHDLAILKYPEVVHPKILEMHKKSWQILKERDAEIIAVSQSTKKDIVQLLGFSPMKVHVVYEALPFETVHAAEQLTEEHIEKIKADLQLLRPYFFFVGTREPRKNLKRLIEAWQPLANNFDLLIAGTSGWDETENEDMFASNPHLRFLGKVSDQELAVLYNEAELFLYPSIDEGFGLPVLEAFYHGVPVLTSNLSALPEVAGNAAELIDPFSVESIRQGIQHLLNESKEDQQKRLQRMIIRLQLFDWGRVAEETMRVYQTAIDHFDDQASSTERF